VIACKESPPVPAPSVGQAAPPAAMTLMDSWCGGAAWQLLSGGGSGGQIAACRPPYSDVNRGRGRCVYVIVIMIEEPPAGDADVEALFRVHATPLLRLAYLSSGDRSVAEEVVQETFLRYVDREVKPAPGREVAYLRRTVFNLLHSRYRHLGVVRRHAAQYRASDGGDTADSAVTLATQERVVEAIRQLPPRQRDCIVLRLYAEASDAEIADALAISAGTVKVHLHRARATLARQLEDLR
jgi:RNA polymerase sigma factor (sigma-70 family)